MLVILNSQAFACSLCYSSVPTAHVFLEFESKDNNVTNINIEWIFSSNFTNLTKQNYDLNANLKLEDSDI